jgi:hypothetical protein
MFVIKAEPTDADAVSATLFAESLFIRTASFRLPSRSRENTLGMTLSSTATTTMASAKPGFTGLNPTPSTILALVEEAGRLVADACEPFGYRAVIAVAEDLTDLGERCGTVA